MTVSELIKQLEKMPQSMRVVVTYLDCGYDDVEEVCTLNVGTWQKYDEVKQSDAGAEEVCLII